MWSPLYTYYSLQSDLTSPECLATDTVVKALLDTGCFVQESNQSFTNAAHFPWVNLALVENCNGNFAVSDRELPLVCQIDVVCSKGQHVDQEVYTGALLKVADTLRWKLFLEEDDEENENVEIIGK